jgi:hypothetical protein
MQSDLEYTQYCKIICLRWSGCLRWQSTADWDRTSWMLWGMEAADVLNQAELRLLQNIADYHAEHSMV